MSLRTAPATGEPKSDRLSYDEIFDMCSNQRRRHALSYLTANETADLGDIARHVAARETGTPADELPRRQRKSVYNSLYQTHVPRMAAVGIVEYDEEHALVAPGSTFDQIEPYVDGLDRGGEVRSSHYFGLALASGLLLTVDGAGALSWMGIPDPAATLFVVALFAALTLTYVSGSNPIDSLRGFRPGSRGQS